MSENTDRNGSSHTPGPWAFEPVGRFTESSRPTVAVVGHVRVVRDGNSVRGYDEHGSDEADAALIAAAPELLDALVSLVAAATGVFEMLEYGQVTKARAAIAKATAHHPTSQEREPSA